MILRINRAGARCSPEDCRAAMEAAQSALPVLDDPADLERRARLFKALGDTTRLRILGLLSGREMCLCEIVDALQGAESTLTHHLRMLLESGLISMRREGKFTYFRLNPAQIQQHRVLDSPGEVGNVSTT